MARLIVFSLGLFLFHAAADVQTRINCLNALCSDNLGRVAKIELKKSDLSLITNDERQELGRLLAEHYKAELQDELKYLKMAKVLIDQGTFLTDRAEIKAVNLMALITQTPRVAVDEKGVDEDATRRIAPDITGNELEAIKRSVAYSLQRRKKIPAILTEDIDRLSQTLTNVQLQQEVRAAHLKYKEVFATYTRDLQLLKTELEADPIASGELGKRLGSGSFTSSDLARLRASFETIMIFVWAWKDEKMQDLLSQSPIDLDPLLAGNKGKTLGRRIVYIERYLKNPENKSHNLKARLESIKHVCEQEVSYARQILPSLQTLEEFRKNESGLRSEYITGLSKWLSKTTMQELILASQKWQMALPPTAKDFYQNLIQPLRDKLKDPEIVYDEKAKRMKLAIWLGRQGQFGTEPNYGRNTQQICERAAIDLLPDHVELGMDKFSLGPMIGLDPEWMKGIAFHEYSHLVSAFMKSKKVSVESRKWYDKSRKCLSDLQPGANHVEEDWADMLSASLGTVNRNCYGMHVADEIGIVNSNPRDLEHSSDFFRALHHQFIQTGAIPPECKPLTFDSAKEVKIRSCL